MILGGGAQVLEGPINSRRTPRATGDDENRTREVSAHLHPRRLHYPERIPRENRE